MKMIPKKFVVIPAVIAVLCCGAYTGAVYAQGQDEKPAGAKMERHGDKDGFFKDLNLTQEQRDKLKANREQSRGKMEAIHTQMKSKRAELKTELEKTTVDKGRIDGIVTELKNLSGQMVDLRVAGLISLKEILTPEQFKKMHDKMEERKGNHGGKRGEGKKDMPPPEDE
jgi:Spy/CpxP family protein refolding chaperone